MMTNENSLDHYSRKYLYEIHTTCLKADQGEKGNAVKLFLNHKLSNGMAPFWSQSLVHAKHKTHVQSIQVTESVYLA